MKGGIADQQYGRSRTDSGIVRRDGRRERVWREGTRGETRRETSSADGLELEALSTVPRDALAQGAERAAKQVAERIARAGVDVTAEHRAGPIVRGVLVFAEEHEADLIVVGASTRGRVSRMLGTVTTRLVERSRRPVLVIAPPAAPSGAESATTA